MAEWTKTVDPPDELVRVSSFSRSGWSVWNDRLQHGTVGYARSCEEPNAELHVGNPTLADEVTLQSRTEGSLSLC